MTKFPQLIASHDDILNKSMNFDRPELANSVGSIGSSSNRGKRRGTTASKANLNIAQKGSGNGKGK